MEIKEEDASGKVTIAAQEEGFLDNLIDFNSEDIGLGMFVPNLKIIEDVDKFRYDVKDNRKLNKVAVWRVFNKTGKYIFNLGIVNYLELMIVNLFLVIHTFYREEELLQEQQALYQEKQSRLVLPYVRAHEYLLLSFGYNLGSVISLSTLAEVTLSKPSLPTYIQFVNVILWICNLYTGFISDFNVVFVWTMWVGC